MLIFTGNFLSNLSANSTGQAADLPLLRVDHLTVHLQVLPGRPRLDKADGE